MLVFVSDIHLTDQLKGPRVSHAQLFERFWERMDHARKGRPARLVFVGDLFDLVRSPRWLETSARPYHASSPEQAAVVIDIVRATLEREKDFAAAIARRVQEGALELTYVLGNHDRLLAQVPEARRLIWHAFTGRDADVEFVDEYVSAEHEVVAYHGHTTDFVCHDADATAPIGDAIGCELIVRYPLAVRRDTQEALPELDDIDDVRPIFAVPSWVRSFALERPELLRPATRAWRLLVEEFLEQDFTRGWMRRHSRLGFSEARKLQLILQLSTGKLLRSKADQSLAEAFRYLQTHFDGRFAHLAAERLNAKQYRGLRYVVNGHSHFASMVPLGQLGGKSACYFNTGTWRTVHQMGRLLGTHPAFLAYDAMSYLVFFPDGDALGRDYEWWTGAMVGAAG